MTEKDKLFKSFLHTLLKKKETSVELLFANNSCPAFISEENIKTDNFENFKIFLDYLSSYQLTPKLILNFGDKKIERKWLKKLDNYKGEKKITFKDSKIKEIDLPKAEINLKPCKSYELPEGRKENIIISVDFNEDIEDLKREFAKTYKLNQELQIIDKKKKKYTKKELLNLSKFISYIVDYLYKKAGKDKEEYKEIVRKNNGFYYLPGFQINCKAKRRVFINLEDLSLSFCPNKTIKGLKYGKIKKGNIKEINSDLFIAMKKVDLKDMPICETCIINEFCGFDCFLSQEQKTGDFFTPHPEFCRFSHKKLLFFLKAQNQFNLNNDQEKKLFNQIKELS